MNNYLVPDGSLFYNKYKKFAKFAQTDEKRGIFAGVPLNYGEMTIVKSDSASASMVHACKLGEKLTQRNLSALVVNCGMNRKRFTEHFHKHHTYAYKNTKEETSFIYYHSMIGDLSGDSDAIHQLVWQQCIGAVIITGWEWVASNWRKKQKLLYFIRLLMDELNVAVIIYSNTPMNVEPGKYSNLGAGKLSLMTSFVAEIDAADELEEEVGKPEPLFEDKEEEKKAEEGVKVMVNEINELDSGSPEIVIGEGEVEGEMERSVIPNDSEGSGNSRMPVDKYCLIE